MPISPRRVVLCSCHCGACQASGRGLIRATETATSAATRVPATSPRACSVATSDASTSPSATWAATSPNAHRPAPTRSNPSQRPRTTSGSRDGRRRPTRPPRPGPAWPPAARRRSRHPRTSWSLPLLERKPTIGDAEQQRLAGDRLAQHQPQRARGGEARLAPGGPREPGDRHERGCQGDRAEQRCEDGSDQQRPARGRSSGTTAAPTAADQRHPRRSASGEAEPETEGGGRAEPLRRGSRATASVARAAAVRLRRAAPGPARAVPAPGPRRPGPRPPAERAERRRGAHRGRGRPRGPARQKLTRRSVAGSTRPPTSSSRGPAAASWRAARTEGP